jgi:EAL domain-containing protein (putative c-di-GMP-specific phosphodiesterase class I)
VLKIDCLFITDIEVQASNIEIVEAIIKMAQILKLKTIAEGVETQEQLNCLKLLHCDEFQGFLFSRPRPESEMSLLLADNLMGKR